MRKPIPKILACTLGFLAACGDGAGPTAPYVPVPLGDGPAVSRVESVGSIRDTVDAYTLLTVQVLDSAGHASRRTAVLFTQAPGTEEIGSSRYTRSLTFETDSVSTSYLLTATDTAGFATVRVRFGTRVGNTLLHIVSVPTQATLSIPFETTAGNLVALTLTPGDTLIKVGESLQYTGRATDRRGNVRSDAVAFTSRSEVVTITPAGRATGAASAYTMVVATATSNSATFRDSVALFVSPEATLAWTANHNDASRMEWNAGSLVVGNLHTPSGATVIWPDSTQTPAWETGGRLVYVRGYNKLIVREHSGSESQVPLGDFTLLSTPDFSPDGAWLYFVGWRSGVSHMYRSRPDGSDIRVLAPDHRAQLLRVSRDGTRIAFADHYTAGGVKVLDLTSGSVRTLTEQPPSGSITEFSGLSWSRDDRMIAYTSAGGADALHLVDVATSSAVGYGGSWVGAVDWSPDGQWLVGRGKLLHLPTGQARSLPWVGRNPAWK